MHKTLAKRIANMVTFLPHNITMPQNTTKEAVLDWIKDLILLLKNHTPHYLHALYNNDMLSAID